MDFLTPQDAPGQLLERIVRNQVNRDPELLIFDFPINQLPDVVYSLHWLKRLVVWTEMPLPDKFARDMHEFAATRLELTPDGLVDADEQMADMLEHHHYLTTRQPVTLTHLSEQIGELDQLEELDLSDQSLTILPDAICELPNLKRLILRNNRLTTLPAAFGKLTTLQRLDLRGNPIQQWPTGFFQLPVHTVWREQIEQARTRKEDALVLKDYKAAAQARKEEMQWGFSG